MRIFRRRRRRARGKTYGRSRGSGFWDALADFFEDLLN